MEKIGNTIKERRKLLGTTQRELAEIADVSVNTLTKIERGEANPSIFVLNRILYALGLEIDVKIKNNYPKKLYYEKRNRLFTRNARRRID